MNARGSATKGTSTAGKKKKTIFYSQNPSVGTTFGKGKKKGNYIKTS